MLVLTRKAKEVVVIDDRITVTVLEVHKDKVRLGISAPADVSVHRHEVWVKIKEASNGHSQNDPTIAESVDGQR